MREWKERDCDERGREKGKSVGREAREGQKWTLGKETCLTEKKRLNKCMQKYTVLFM